MLRTRIGYLTIILNISVAHHVHQSTEAKLLHKVEEWLQAGVIRPSTSPVTLVKRKSGEYRSRIDYAQLNEAAFFQCQWLMMFLQEHSQHSRKGNNQMVNK